MGKEKAPLTFRSMICLMLTIGLIFAMKPTVASSLVETRTTVASSGAINYNLSRNSLALSALGDDYLLFQDPLNCSPEIWNDYLFEFEKWNCNTARLSFTFADDPKAGVVGESGSVYDQTKMDRVLDLLTSVGVKGILSNGASINSNFYGSQAWVNDWKAVAQHYKGDSRIAAFMPINEPYPEYVTNSLLTTDGLVVAMGSLIDQIRNIDPTRTIIFPLTVGILEDQGFNNWAAFYDSLQSHGILAKGNIIYDVVHPYYFENSWDGDMTPVEKADWYRDNVLDPAINYFGASNIWCGETFGFPQSDYSYNLQKEFTIQMINHFVSYGVGFQMWCYFSFVHFNNWTLETDILTSSEYYIRYC